MGTRMESGSRNDQRKMTNGGSHLLDKSITTIWDLSLPVDVLATLYR